MGIDDFFSFMRQTTSDGSLPLNKDQKKALIHNFNVPLWMIAGPGTGKTHTLVWMVLKRMVVDQIAPEKIFLTTFTKKAAAELEGRLVLVRNQLAAAGLEKARDIDLSKINLGTLHSLCSRILNEERYEPTLRVRVLEDEIAQKFFLSRFPNSIMRQEDLSFWNYFGYSGQFITRSKKIQHAIKLFNRKTENQVNIHNMMNSGNEYMKILAQSYGEYRNILQDKRRLDQAHLQLYFLQFLKSLDGKRFLKDGFTVLVDEYQDTNPIQEEIYFHLTGEKADMTVVGDDDQSLYRFRGATVESLIRFDEACHHFFDKNPKQVNLNENRRSHNTIIKWVNRFIENHPDMKDSKIPVRAPGKRSIISGPQYSGDYPAIMVIDEKTHINSGKKMGELIKQLYDEKLIKDYSQVALLSFSTRETTQGIKQYVDGLLNNGIPYYNPRNKSTHKQDIFLAMVGALITILDKNARDYNLPQRRSFNYLANSVKTYITNAKEAYSELVDSGDFPDLEAYVNKTIFAIENATFQGSKENQYLKRQGGRRVTLSGILYKLMAFEPFYTAMSQDEDNSGRLKTLNLILSEYESLFNNGEIQVEWQETTRMARVEHWSLYNFYSVLIDGIHNGLNDPEDEEISIQPGKVNVMTIHQSKGLEFEVVFVIRPDKQPFVSDTHVLEDILTPFVQRVIQPSYRSRELRATEDTIRLFFVAYSRAKNLLVLAGSDCSKWETVLGYNQNGQPIKSITALEAEGVYKL